MEIILYFQNLPVATLTCNIVNTSNSTACIIWNEVIAQTANIKSLKEV